MKPPAFQYLAPTTLEDALAARAEHGDRATVLAGGQSLVPLLNLRLARPELLIDLGRAGGLAGIRELDGALAIGAMTRYRDVAASPLVREHAPLLASAIPYIGHPAIRNRGTVGGCIAHADPAAEIPAVALALDATIIAASSRGERSIAAKDFFLGFLRTALASDELVVELRVPKPPGPASARFGEVARRHGDYAIVGAGVSVVKQAGSDVLSDIRIGMIGVGRGPVRASAAEELLRGTAPDRDALGAAARAAAADIEPHSGGHASAEYRARLAAPVLRRTLEEVLTA